ncbi:MAG: DUF697 domain-containing protein [Deltaproteobacteria bacterium]|nr:DUF697 domain-containing protein [Deltaproteobacteria bacterium]
MRRYRDTLKRIMDGDFAHASEQDRRNAVREVIDVCSVAAGAVSVQPIPFLDVALISPIQIAMVQAIARVHGHSLDKRSVIEMLSTFGASIIAQNVIIAAAKFVPFAGWVMAIAMAYALTYAIGEVSDHYFLKGRGVTTDELRERFERVYKEKREEKQKAHKANASLKDKLEQLKEAHKAGLLTEEEFNRKKEELLQGF